MSSPIQVACPSCGTGNRVPADKLAQQPKCGKCAQALFNGHPIELNDGNFAAIVDGTEIPVVVDCWASWCGPCRQFAPVFEEASAKLEPGFRLAKLDTDANQETAARLGIRSIPTLILFKGGREAGRISGAMPLGTFTEWLHQHA